MIGRQTTRARDLDAEPDGGAVFTGRRDDRWRQRLTGLLLAFLWLIPVFVTALAGWWAWRVDVAEARDHADVMARLVAERVEHAIDTQAMVLDWVLDRTRGMSWEDIEASPAVHVLLQDLDHRYDASAEIFMIDGEGRLRGDSVAFPLTGERAIDPGPLETVSLQDAAVLIGRPAGGPVSGVF